MFCTSCGKVVEDGQVFCMNCGAKIVYDEVVAEKVAPAVEPEKETVAQPVVEPVKEVAPVAPPVTPQPTYNQQPTATYNQQPTATYNQQPTATYNQQPQQTYQQPVYQQPVQQPVYQQQYQQPVYRQPVVKVPKVLGPVPENIVHVKKAFCSPIFIVFLIAFVANFVVSIITAITNPALPSDSMVLTLIFAIPVPVLFIIGASLLYVQSKNEQSRSTGGLSVLSAYYILGLIFMSILALIVVILFIVCTAMGGQINYALAQMMSQYGASATQILALGLAFIYIVLFIMLAVVVLNIISNALFIKFIGNLKRSLKTDAEPKKASMFLVVMLILTAVGSLLGIIGMFIAPVFSIFALVGSALALTTNVTNAIVLIDYNKRVKEASQIG